MHVTFFFLFFQNGSLRPLSFFFFFFLIFIYLTASDLCCGMQDFSLRLIGLVALWHVES